MRHVRRTDKGLVSIAAGQTGKKRPPVRPLFASPEASAITDLGMHQCRTGPVAGAYGGKQMFEKVESRGVDQILALMKTYRADPRETKVDLVVGVYQDSAGRVPVMRAVKSAEERLVANEDTKTYVGIVGDADFRALVPQLLLGPALADSLSGRYAVAQTPGGSGALKVASDFLNMIEPGNRLWVSTPTWANHIPVAADAGLTVAAYPYFRASDRGLDFDGMMSHLSAQAKAGEVLLLHACCHNPTGVDLSLEQWSVVTNFVIDRGLLPLVDCAYQGLGDGMDQDAAGLRHVAARVPEMLLASSFSKNFGIYRERTGALTLLSRSAAELEGAMAGMETVIRSNYSMPPSHGARVVSTVLGDPALTAAWSEELTGMRTRIAAMRSALREALEQHQVPINLSFITSQRGMFSFTGLTPPMVEMLRRDYGIYVALDGRINVAGINPDNVGYIAEGFAAAFSMDN